MEYEVAMETEKRKKRTRRSFTEEFKREAVRLVLQEGKMVAEVGRDLDVHASVVGNWVRQAQVDRGKGPPGALTSEEKEELSKLRREVRTLRMERDILKKAAAFFAKEST